MNDYDILYVDIEKAVSDLKFDVKVNEEFNKHNIEPTNIEIIGAMLLKCDTYADTYSFTSLASHLVSLNKTLSKQLTDVVNGYDINIFMESDIIRCVSINTITSFLQSLKLNVSAVPNDTIIKDKLHNRAVLLALGSVILSCKKKGVLEEVLHSISNDHKLSKSAIQNINSVITAL